MRGPVEAGERFMADTIIHAQCHAADERMSVTFDASPRFNEVDPESIIHLAQQGWSAVSVAEALQHRSGNERLRELIQYATERPWSTFECIVNGSEALVWLDAYRPAVAAKIREAR